MPIVTQSTTPVVQKRYTQSGLLLGALAFLLTWLLASTGAVSLLAALITVATLSFGGWASLVIRHRQQSTVPPQSWGIRHSVGIVTIMAAGAATVTLIF